MPSGTYKRTKPAWNKGLFGFNLGRKISEETRKKLSISHRGQHNSVETEFKRGNIGYWFGKKRSPFSKETRERMGEARKGEKNHNWKPKIEKVCLICSKKFEVIPARKDTAKHCSCRCNAIALLKNHKNKDTDIELIFEAGLKSLNIPYQKQVPMEGITIADFLLPNKRVVFCDGEYWHTGIEREQRDLRINQELKEKGYKVYRFWGKEIKNNFQQCFNQINLS